MNFDISPLLNEWEYRPGQIGVRKFKGKDGIEKIQLRVDLGLLQMNTHGRPDGKRPYGHESLLEHYEAKLAKHVAENDGDGSNFKLQSEDCTRLLQESIQYHHRYICLFQLGDFAGVTRDTERNLKVFNFVQEFAATEEMAWSLQQFRAQLLMMQTRARASMAIENDDYALAIQIVLAGIEDIRDFFRANSKSDLAEQSGEIQSLETWLKELESRRPLTRREELEKALHEAVQKEDYEKAAKVRDSLKNLKASPQQ